MQYNKFYSANLKSKDFCAYLNGKNGGFPLSIGLKTSFIFPILHERNRV